MLTMHQPSKELELDIHSIQISTELVPDNISYGGDVYDVTSF
jgi:hypothetical protein